VLRFPEGAPALIESRLGEGRVLLWASTVDRDWTNLPIQPVFLPLVQQATRYLARAPMREPEAPLVVGQHHEILLRDGDLRVEVTQPSGGQRSFEKDKLARPERPPPRRPRPPAASTRGRGRGAATPGPPAANPPSASPRPPRNPTGPSSPPPPSTIWRPAAAPTPPPPPTAASSSGT